MAEPQWNGAPEPPRELQEAIGSIFTGERCLTVQAADQAIRAELVELGMSDWRIHRGLGITNDGCVSAGIDTVHGRIRLDGVQHPDVRKALDLVAEELLERCATKDDAVAMVASTLSGFGETGWEIRGSDLVGGPLDRLDEIKRHAEAGCAVYSGTGMTPEGTRQYYIGGLNGDSMAPASPDPSTQR